MAKTPRLIAAKTPRLIIGEDRDHTISYDYIYFVYILIFFRKKRVELR